MSVSSIKERKSYVDSSSLTAQQQLFVSHLIADDRFDAKNAAIKAGYKSPAKAGYKLLGKSTIAKVIGRALFKRKEKLGIDADRVLKELACIAFMNPKDLFDEVGEMKQIHDLDDNVARAISSIETEEQTDKYGHPVSKVKVRFWPKNNALELIAKHLGMLDDRMKVDHDIGSGTKDLLAGLLEQVENGNNVIDAIEVK